MRGHEAQLLRQTTTLLPQILTRSVQQSAEIATALTLAREHRTGDDENSILKESRDPRFDTSACCLFVQIHYALNELLLLTNLGLNRRVHASITLKNRNLVRLIPFMPLLDRRRTFFTSVHKGSPGHTE